MKGLRIRPEQSGIKTSLFDLEADIMEAVWTSGWDQFAVADVHRELEKSRDIAYTTVMTTVVRLYEKELLDRERDGRRWLYWPLFTREDFVRETAREVLASLPPLGREEAVALLVDQVAQADMTELDHLETLIRQKRAELRK